MSIIKHFSDFFGEKRTFQWKKWSIIDYGGTFQWENKSIRYKSPALLFKLLITDTCHLLTTTFKYHGPPTEPLTTLPTPLRHQDGSHLCESQTPFFSHFIKQNFKARKRYLFLSLKRSLQKRGKGTFFAFQKRSYQKREKCTFFAVGSDVLISAKKEP